jgi:hypothetical protein
MNFCGHCKKISQLYPERKINYKHATTECPKLIDTLCYNCKLPGHTPKYCKKPKSMCVLCKHIGHEINDCGYKTQILNSTIITEYKLKNRIWDTLT